MDISDSTDNTMVVRTTLVKLVIRYLAFQLVYAMPVPTALPIQDDKIEKLKQLNEDARPQTIKQASVFPHFFSDAWKGPSLTCGIYIIKPRFLCKKLERM